MKNWIVVAMCILSISATGQAVGQQISGRVFDQITGRPLSSSAIVVVGSSPLLSATTDGHGYFVFNDVEVGTYLLEVSHIGYSSIRIAEVRVSSSRPAIVEIAMTEAPLALEEVTVKSQLDPIGLSGIGVHTITAEQTLRYASTYFDPARLSAAYAGVASYNDQGNNMVIRGYSPNSMGWRLHGATIVNPNHTSNAGTLSDKPTQAGGGVNILSTQMMGHTKFLKGGFTSEYGNSLSGIYDMRFRKGQKQKTEVIVQAGLIGFDLAVEGPVGESNATYLANYRYSFVGLLTSMGVDFGGEAIAFQDFSFHVNLPHEKFGNFSIFGMGGASKNEFQTVRDYSQWEENKDQFDIFFNSNMLASGVSHKVGIGANAAWNTTAVYSRSENNRESTQLDLNYTSRFFESDYIERGMVSFNSYADVKTGNGLLTLGLLADFIQDELVSYEDKGLILTGVQALADIKANSYLYQPYVSYQIDFNRIGLNAGIRYFQPSIGVGGIEPRLNVAYEGSQGSIYSSVAVVHQMHQPGVYYSQITQQLNEELDPTKAIQFEIGTKRNLGFGKVIVESYLHQISNVPIGRYSEYSSLNAVEGIVSEDLESTGTGRNIGVELTYNRRLKDDWYVLASSSLYDSKFTGQSGFLHNTRFNGGYGFNITGGKEFRKTKKGTERVFSVNSQATYLGGIRSNAVDVSASELQQETVYDLTSHFTDKLNDYIRLDARVSWTKHKPKSTRVLSLDIQNVLNIQNDAFLMYDPFLNEVKVSKQLGLIPILTYRVEF